MAESRYREYLANLTQAPSGDFQIEVFRGEGVIVDLEIKRWRGKAKLETGELGMQEDKLPPFQDFLGKYIGLGQKLLLPKDFNERIAAVEVQARGNLKEYAYDSPWGSFVPFGSYDAFMEINEACREKFFAMRDEVDERYDEILDTIEQDYAVLAVVVFKKMNSIPIDQVTKAPRSFIDTFLQQVMAQIPPRKKIYDSFIYETKFMSIPDIMMPIAAGEPLPETAAEVLPSGRSKSEVRQEAAEQVRQTILGEQGENLEAFLDTVVSHLRELAREGSEDILASIDRNGGKLVGRTSVKARNLIRKLQLKDFYGDARLREYVDRLESLLAVAPKERSVIEIRSSFAGLKEYSESSLAELAVMRQAASAGRAGDTVIPLGGTRTPRSRTASGDTATVLAAEESRRPPRHRSEAANGIDPDGAKS